MARRKARQRISYVLPLADSPGGHRLGVNSLAVDCDQSILYSAGRDGVICAWDLNVPLRKAGSDHDRSGQGTAKSSTTFRSQSEAHTHWVNDILLAQSNTALVSASSDITVKVWRPHAEDGQKPMTIGRHDDYVKCLASPGAHAEWVASGGLDRKIRVWDLNGGGEKLQLDAGEGESSTKGSVYALSVRGSLMASGGPDSVLRLWDPKSGKRITKFVGHTDNLRAILINEPGDTIMTASSDQTIKVWSLAAGRCINTLTMHNDSVWSLYSEHPQLSVFYSSDRSGLVAKTDVRGSPSMDEGISVAVAQEHEGVNKVIVGGDYFWTATSSASINRWKDVDTSTEVQEAESPRFNRRFSLVTRSKVPSPSVEETARAYIKGESLKKIPLNSILKISNAIAPKLRDLEASTIYSGASIRKPSEAFVDAGVDTVLPIHNLPDETIEGQHGLIKHLILNDRKRVLTLDTAGEVVMWDLLKCVPIQSFGKRHLEDVMPEVNTMESVANWCGVDTRTGRLAVALEENYCFDAEVYADETSFKDSIEFREDQRINLGKWVLRYLFSSLIDEEIRKDETTRAELQGNHGSVGIARSNAPQLDQLPQNSMSSWQKSAEDEESAITPRPTNGVPPTTPGLAIGLATPGLSTTTASASNNIPGLPTTTEYNGEVKPGPAGSIPSGDYFSTNPPPPSTQTSQAANTKASETSNETHNDNSNSPVDHEKDTKSSSRFGKKFRMNFPKKLGRSSADKHPVQDEKAEESDKSSEKEDKIVEDNFYGIVQKIRNEYEEKLSANPAEPLAPGINPSQPNETPVLKPPPFTTIIIQEDKMDSGGLADLYRGTVKSVGQDASLIEKAAPMWLGDLLLRNQTPVKDVVKVSFILQPHQDLLPSIAGADGNARLNANRMLRAKKILGYVAERIDPVPEGEELAQDALKPEEYLELYCHDQLIPSEMTLATIRAHVWKTGGDVMLYFRSNGRKAELEANHAAAKAKLEEEGKEKVGGVGGESLIQNNSAAVTGTGPVSATPPLQQQQQTASAPAKSSGAILGSGAAVAGSGGTGFM